MVDVTIDEFGRPEPPAAAGELETLVGFLDHQRATLAWKARGLSSEELTRTVAASTMTLGGILKHMAFVEDHWFTHVLLGRPRSAPWATVDWGAEPDWEWRTAALDSADDLRRRWEEAVGASRRALAEALEVGGTDQVARGGKEGEQVPSLRWILVHMVEEYARHNGHADLMREAIDGEVGE